MSEDQCKGRLEGLEYALGIVNNRRVIKHTAAYTAALDEMQIFLDAAIERVKNGEEMYSTATCQEAHTPS